MKIGITERGDAGLDLSWENSIINNSVDGAILITKNITQQFTNKVIELYNAGKNIIVHCGCTGWGGTVIEPHVPTYDIQLQNLINLIRNGFPSDNIVLRIDPIIPTDEGLQRVQNVMDTFLSNWNQISTNKPRIRISVLDEYKHVKQRFCALNMNPIYGDSFGPSVNALNQVYQTLLPYQDKIQINHFETCAEANLANRYPNLFTPTGCVSQHDINVMGLTYNGINNNPQGRKGCLCLTCKTELLSKPQQCPHRCAYCYWMKDYTPTN